MKWGERRKRIPLRPGELAAIDAERRRQEAEAGKNNPRKKARTEEEVFAELLGPTGSLGLSSIDFAGDAQVARFRAYAAKARASREAGECTEKGR